MDDKIVSGQHWFLEGKAPSLRMWIFAQMSLGAFYAAIVFVAVVGFVWLIYAISWLLPEDPYAMIDAGRSLTALV